MKKSSRCHRLGFILRVYMKHRPTKEGGTRHDAFHRNLRISRDIGRAIRNAAARQSVKLGSRGNSAQMD